MIDISDDVYKYISCSAAGAPAFLSLLDPTGSSGAFLFDIYYTACTYIPAPPHAGITKEPQQQQQDRIYIYIMYAMCTYVCGPVAGHSAAGRERSPIDRAEHCITTAGNVYINTPASPRGQHVMRTTSIDICCKPAVRFLLFQF